MSLAVEAVRRALELAESDDEGGGSGRRAGESKAVLFGNSLGGLVGCRVALAMPERVAGLCLASPAGKAFEVDLILFGSICCHSNPRTINQPIPHHKHSTTPPRPTTTTGAPMTPADLAEVQALFQLDSHATGLAFLHRVTAFPDRLPLLLPHLMAWCCRARASTGPIAHIMSRAQARHMLTRRELRRLKVPTLLIWGRHERVFSERLRSFFVKHLPRRGSVPRTEEDFCRVPFLDDPDRLVELLEEFVRKYCVSELIIG